MVILKVKMSGFHRTLYLLIDTEKSPLIIKDKVGNKLLLEILNHTKSPAVPFNNSIRLLNSLNCV